MKRRLPSPPHDGDAGNGVVVRGGAAASSTIMGPSDSEAAAAANEVLGVSSSPSKIPRTITDPSSNVPAPRIPWDSLQLHDGEIGRGSAAYVKRADFMHPNNGPQQVVVKILLPPTESDTIEDFRRRYWSEVNYRVARLLSINSQSCW
jgi:hypothetical protein